VPPLDIALGAVAQQLFAAWAGLPKRDFVPDRASFDPMAVASILPVVSLLQRLGADEWRFRLVGTELERRWGRSLTGCNYIELVSLAMAEIMRRELVAIAQQPCGSWSLRRLQFRSGQLVEVETLRLPLRSDEGGITLVLSCSGELGTTKPYSLDQPREVIAFAPHQFVDLGAGIPAAGVLADVRQ
jgi:hypothetical protein